MKKYIYTFFNGLLVVGTDEKKISEKKKAGGWMGYCPSACVGSQYRGLYRDIRLGKLAWEQPGGHDTARTQPRHGRACATIRPAWATTRLAALKSMRQRALAAWLVGCVAIQ